MKKSASSPVYPAEKGGKVLGVLIMPDQITVSEFVVETNEDYKSPTASNFTTRMPHCRNTVAALEEVSAPSGNANTPSSSSGVSQPLLNRAA